MTFKVTSYTGFILKLESGSSTTDTKAATTLDAVTPSDEVVAKCFVPYTADSVPHLHGSCISLGDDSNLVTPAADIDLCGRLMEHARRQLEGHFQQTQLAANNGRSNTGKLPVAALCAPDIDGLAVVDAAVRVLAHSLRLDIIILDPVDFADGADGVLGPNFSSRFWQLYYADQTAAEVAEGHRYMKAIMHMGQPHGSSQSGSSRGRLLYLRDFGTFRHALSDRLLRAIHEASSCDPCSIVVAGIVPTWKVQGSGDAERTVRDKKSECEDFLRELKGDSFLDFLKRNYNTYPNFVDQFQCIEDLFSAAFADHYQGGEAIGTVPPTTSKESPVQSLVLSGTSYAPITVSEGTTPSSNLHLEFTTLVRVGLSRKIPAHVSSVSKTMRQRRFIAANIRLLNIVLRKLGKVLRGPASEKEWNLLLEGRSDPTILDSLGSRIYSKVQQKGIAEALPALSSLGDLPEALRVASEAEDSWQLRVKSVISEQSFDPVVAQVGAGGALSKHERALLSCIVDPSTIRTQFADVCLGESVQRTLTAVIHLPLTNPDAFKTGILATEFGGGILLYGPPGTGKTMVCRALAKQSGVRMLQVQASNIQRSAVGESEQIVTAIFALARKLGPCIVFIDELDAFFSRQTEHTPVWHRSLITEILQEMDGLRTADLNREKGVIVVAATNRPQDLDDAVVRRLPRRIFIDLPARKDREKILRKYLESEEHEESIASAIAAKTTLYSGSDLRHLVVAAALVAVQENRSQPGQSPRRKITVGDFNKAMKEVLPSCASDMKALELLRSWGGRSGRRSEGPHTVAGGGEFGITVAGPITSIKLTTQPESA